MKKIYLIILIITLFLISYLFLQRKKVSITFKIEFDNNIGYISIYNTNLNEIENIHKQINILLKEYEQLTDRYHSYDGVKNLYYLKNNKETSDYIEIDPKLYNMIKIGLDWNDKSNGIFDIRYGNIIDIWKSYENQESVLPTKEEISLAKQYTVLDINLIKNNQIKNNHPNLILDDMKIGYVVDEIADMLKESNINFYTIHLDNIIKVGMSYTDELYKIGLESPIDEMEIIKVIEIENKAVASIGLDKEFSTYKDQLYHKFIPMNTMIPTSKKDAFSIVGDSALEMQIISYILYNSDDISSSIKEFDNIQLITY